MQELEKTFDFYKRRSYEATGNLTRTRSRECKIVRPKIRYDLWNRPAPDLTMQLYHPKPVSRNSREAVQPGRYRASFDDDAQTQKPVSRGGQLPAAIQTALFSQPEQSKEREGLTVSPRALRPYEAKLLFVKDGMLPTDKYIGLKDPDFRGYPSMKSLGQDEFQTSYERDPYNLQFKSNHLDQVFGGSLPQRDQAVGAQMGDCPLRQPPSWQRELILPREPFPNRFKGTTRHRPLYRSPHSAFLQRVETKLSQEWQKGDKSNRLAAPTR